MVSVYTKLQTNYYMMDTYQLFNNNSNAALLLQKRFICNTSSGLHIMTCALSKIISKLIVLFIYLLSVI